MSFIQNVSAAVDRLGPQSVGIIMGLGATDWPSDADRDAFLDTLVKAAQ